MESVELVRELLREGTADGHADLRLGAGMQEVLEAHLRASSGSLGIGAYAVGRDEVFARWRRSRRGLGDCPNVYVKLGGLGMRINDLECVQAPHT